MSPDQRTRSAAGTTRQVQGLATRDVASIPWAPLALSNNRDRPQSPWQDAGGETFNRSHLEAAGGAYGGNPLYGTQYVYVQRGSDALYKLLGEVTRRGACNLAQVPLGMIFAVAAA